LNSGCTDDKLSENLVDYSKVIVTAIKFEVNSADGGNTGCFEMKVGTDTTKQIFTLLVCVMAVLVNRHHHHHQTVIYIVPITPRM